MFFYWLPLADLLNGCFRRPSVTFFGERITFVCFLFNKIYFVDLQKIELYALLFYFCLIAYKIGSTPNKVDKRNHHLHVCIFLDVLFFFFENFLFINIKLLSLIVFRILFPINNFSRSAKTHLRLFTSFFLLTIGNLCWHEWKLETRKVLNCFAFGFLLNDNFQFSDAVIFHCRNMKFLLAFFVLLSLFVGHVHIIIFKLQTDFMRLRRI